MIVKTFDENAVKPPYGQCTIAEYYILYGLVRLYKPKIIIETGTFYGAASYVMASALLDIGDEDSKIVTIDNDIRSVNKAKENLAKLAVIDKIRVVHGTSDVIKLLDNKIDFAFIDGGHDYESCLKDLRAVDGTPIIVLHDANTDSVKNAIMKFVISSRHFYNYIFFYDYPEDTLIKYTSGFCILLKYGDKP